MKQIGLLLWIISKIMVSNFKSYIWVWWGTREQFLIRPSNSDFGWLFFLKEILAFWVFKFYPINTFCVCMTFLDGLVYGWV